ncbi:MAG TPA: acyl-CoA thioesterase/BAAT N-terminal domain-containing protein [Gaiellaceae bacterium]|nr:acyl-CoA thioesterase/BAAT N-terminal domain-containing protein [Gaiellaceae bacterium]
MPPQRTFVTTLRIAICAAFAAGAVACGGGHPAAHITVTPAASVQDKPLSIRMIGLGGHRRVTVVMSSVDARGTRFTGSAIFEPTANGTLDLSRARALGGGSYTGVWPMGLLSSMAAPAALVPQPYYRWGRTARAFTVRVTANRKTLATTSFTRSWQRGSYETLTATVQREGFVGTFYSPRGARHQPAVLAFGGTEGGADGSYEGERLAANGIPTLFVGYFAAPGLPKVLRNIPLEYFRDALLWLRNEDVPPVVEVRDGGPGVIVTRLRR